MPFDEKNVLGGALALCSASPRTGFYRDGCCNTGTEDHGLHVVCAQMTGEFLEFARAQGNDLVTPAPEYGFPGLKPGDRWCICAGTWRQAYEAGVAAPSGCRVTSATASDAVHRRSDSRSGHSRQRGHRRRGEHPG